MESKMYSWSGNDVVRSITTSVFVAIIAVLYGLTSQADFNVFTTDWGAILGLTVNAVFTTFIARMAEKFVTDSDGKVFGKIG